MGLAAQLVESFKPGSTNEASDNLEVKATDNAEAKNLVKRINAQLDQIRSHEDTIKLRRADIDRIQDVIADLRMELGDVRKDIRDNAARSQF